MKNVIILMAILLFASPIYASSIHDSLNEFKVDYDVPTSTTGGGTGGGGGGGGGGGAVQEEADPAKLNFSASPKFFKEFLLANNDIVKDFTLLNPNGESITVGVRVDYNAEDEIVCSKVGFQYSRDQQEFPEGRAEWSVPAGTPSNEGKISGVIVVNEMADVPAKAFNVPYRCNIVFFGDKVNSVVVPFELVTDTRANFLFTNFYTLKLGSGEKAILVELNLAKVFAIGGVSGAIYYASRRPRRDERR